MTDQAKFGALGTVLAKNLNEIEDLPDYIAPPPGVYKLMILSCGQKVINEKTAIVVEYVILENKGLNNAQEDAAEAASVKYTKDRISEAFYFDKPERIDTVISVLKKKFGGLSSVLGTTNLLEILEKMQNLTVEATLGRRQDEKDTTKFHPYTRNIVAAV